MLHNSIRLRQRRPALIIEEKGSENEIPKPVPTPRTTIMPTSTSTASTASTTIKTMPSSTRSINSASRRCSMIAIRPLQIGKNTNTLKQPISTSSGLDGLVRANIARMSVRKLSIFDKQPQVQVEEQQQQKQQDKSQLHKQIGETKKSEFDPRSLRASMRKPSHQQAAEKVSADKSKIIINTTTTNNMVGDRHKDDDLKISKQVKREIDVALKETSFDGQCDTNSDSDDDDGSLMSDSSTGTAIETPGVISKLTKDVGTRQVEESEDDQDEGRPITCETKSLASSENTIIIDNSSKNSNNTIRNDSKVIKSALKKTEFKQDPIEIVGEAIENDGETTDDEEEVRSAGQVLGRSSTLSKFSMLRQSFKGAALNSMLKLSGRASMRVKQPATKTQESETKVKPDLAMTEKRKTNVAEPTKQQKKSQSLANERASALALAEANLIAAKQLKQQAQRFMEQQRREQQQQQLNSMEQTNMILAAAAAAVQYNQQVQRQQQQQQQIIYQQNVAAVAAQQQYNPMGVAMPQFDPMQLPISHTATYSSHSQRYQQNHAHTYMAAAAAAAAAQQMALAMTPNPVMNYHHQQQHQPHNQQNQLYYRPKHQHPSNLIYQQPNQQQALMLPTNSPSSQAHLQHQHQQHQLIPMSVNHHSSFNIVYGGAAANGPVARSNYNESPIVAAQSAQQLTSAPQLTQQQQQIVIPTQHQSVGLPAKQSLGATMRKTMRSILSNRLSMGQSQIHALSQREQDRDATNNSHRQQEDKKARAIGYDSYKTLTLNSEGSADSASSESTSSSCDGLEPDSSPKQRLKGILTNRDNNNNIISRKSSRLPIKTTTPSTDRDSFVQAASLNKQQPKSVLKKNSISLSTKLGDNFDTPSSASSSSSTSPSRKTSLLDDKLSFRNQMSSTLTKEQALKYRKSIAFMSTSRLDDHDDKYTKHSGTYGHRKNVTFSAELTSIS